MDTVHLSAEIFRLPFEISKITVTSLCEFYFTGIQAATKGCTYSVAKLLNHIFKLKTNTTKYLVFLIDSGINLDILVQN